MSKQAPDADEPMMRSDAFDEVIRRAFRVKMESKKKPAKKAKRPKAKKKAAR